MEALNRPHFHAWITAWTGTMFCKLAKGCHASQAGRLWAKRNHHEQEQIVLKCEDPKCRPKLD